MLNAGKLKIDENGALAPNTWAATTTHATGSAIDSKGGKINFLGGSVNDNTDPTVKEYLVDMGAANVVIAPGESGNFTFLRQVK